MAASNNILAMANHRSPGHVSERFRRGSSMAMMVRYNVGVQVRETFELKQIDEEEFEE
ncbi:MAG: hypothetical protein ACRDTK_13125 [Mycobacterium sp.]